MTKTRTLGLLIPIALLLAATAWLLLRTPNDALDSGRGEASASPGAQAAPAYAEAANASADAGKPESRGSELARVAVPDTGSQPGTEVAALVGRVLDDAGAPVAGALVACTPGLGMTGGFDLANIDWSDESNFDPAAWGTRLDSARQQKVEARTDAQGKFRVVPKGQSRDVYLRVSARSYAILDKDARRPAGGDVDVGALTLKRGAVVSGRVLDREGRPIAASRVARRAKAELQFGDFDFEFPGAETFEALRDGEGGVTDAAGRFELAHVEPGEFLLRARHPDHPVARLDGLKVEPGQTLADLVVVAEPGATIEGRVLGIPAGTKGLRVQASSRQAPNGQQQPGLQMPGLQMPGLQGLDLGAIGDLVADVGMGFAERTAEVGPDGAFVLRGLHVGRDYRVQAALTGQGLAGSASCSERLEVASGSKGVELRYDAGSTVTFRAVAARGAAPVEKLWVSHQLKGGGGLEGMLGMMPRPARMKSYPDGRVTLSGLRPKKKQTLSLTVEALGFARFQRDAIELPVQGGLDLGTIELVSAPLLHVTVTWAGKPIEGATVRLREQRDRGTSRRGDNQGGGPGNGGMRWGNGGDWGNALGGMLGGTRTAKTDAEGRCDLNAFPGAKGIVSVTTKELAPYESEPVAMPEAEDSRHVAKLTSGGTAEITVVDADGKPLADTRVEHAPPGGAGGAAGGIGAIGGGGGHQTSAAGVAVFDKLVPGTHRFRIASRSNGFDLGAMAANFGDRGQGRQSGAGWESVEVADATLAKLRLVKPTAVTLRGTVRENGVPLADARVAFVRGAGGEQGGAAPDPMGAFAGLAGGAASNARTGEDGGYVLKNVAAGAHRLRVTHKGRAMPATVALTLAPGENTFDVDLETTVLRGTVRDPQGKPVADATVSVRAAAAADAAAGAADQVQNMLQGAMPGFDFGAGMGQSSVKSAADGSYELRGVQAGVRVQVRASAKGYAPSASEPVELARGGTRTGVDVQLAGAGTIEVVAQGAAVFTSARATLEAGAADGKDAGTAAPAFQLLNNGKCKLEGLRPGRWKVELIAPGDGAGAARQTRVVDVVAGETVRAEFG